MISCIDDELEKNFCLVNSASGISGFIYKDRINFFKGYKQIKLVKYEKNKSLFADKAYSVKIVSEKIDNNKQNYSTNPSNKSEYKFYKGKPFWGTDGDFPPSSFYRLNEIVIKYSNKILTIPNSELEQFLFPSQGLVGANELVDFKIFYLKSDLCIINYF